MQIMRKSITLGAMVVFIAACSTSKPHNANVTNYETAGNLEVTNHIGCISPAELINKYTPPDLYEGMIQCVKSGKEINAVYLFSLAGAYTYYDSQRVSDSTARQAHSVLLMNALNSVSESEKQKLMASLQSTLGNPSKLPEICSDINKIGPPNYYPTYMIQHGMNAFLSSKSSNDLVGNFNSSSAWQSSLEKYLHCPHG